MKKFRAKSDKGGDYELDYHETIKWVEEAENDREEPDVVRNLDELSEMDFDDDIKGQIREAYYIYDQRRKTSQN